MVSLLRCWPVMAIAMIPVALAAGEEKSIEERIGFGPTHWIQQVRDQLRREPQSAQTLTCLNAWHEEILLRFWLLEKLEANDEVLDLSICIVGRVLSLIVERQTMSHSDHTLLLAALSYIIRSGDERHLDSFEAAAKLYPHITFTTFKKKVVPSFRAAFLRLTQSSCKNLL